MPPRDFWPGNISEKRVKEKKEKGWKKWDEKKEYCKNCKREGGKLEMKVGKVIKRGEGEDLFFFFFFFFCFSLLKTTEICFGSTRNGKFSTGKSISRREKNQERWLCPLRKICLLRPCLRVGCPGFSCVALLQLSQSRTLGPRMLGTNQCTLWDTWKRSFA